MSHSPGLHVQDRIDTKQPARLGSAETEQPADLKHGPSPVASFSTPSVSGWETGSIWLRKPKPE